MGVADVSKRILLGRKLRSTQLGEHLRSGCKALPEPHILDVFDQVYAEGSPELDAQKAGAAAVLVYGAVGRAIPVDDAQDAHRVLTDDARNQASQQASNATEQLSTWGERVGVDVVTGPEGSDPASVAFEAVQTGIRDGADVVMTHYCMLGNQPQTQLMNWRYYPV